MDVNAKYISHQQGQHIIARVHIGVSMSAMPLIRMHPTEADDDDDDDDSLSARKTLSSGYSRHDEL